MQVDLHPTRFADRVLASFLFFTRLPLWRWRQPPRQAYERVVEQWPLVGWLTGGLMALIVWFGPMVMPVPIALLAAIAARMMLTGALHEDGLADFFDGFGGGGNDRERVLAIMKDSHIGTYGVISLVLYLGLLFFTLYSLPTETAAMAILAADPFAKMLTSQLIMMMPYARTAETAKNRTVYRRPSTAAAVGLAFQGLLPMGLFLWFNQDVSWSVVIFMPSLVMYFLYRLIWGRLRGYTGDCCGAVCLLTELATLIAIVLN